jgi:3-deoxy-D-manno-octulosonate 8-phosphate phosphatase (KDO 8-P phosphatase)
MIENKLKNIRLLLLDVDGVLTDGSILYGDTGEEMKAFNVKDGLGIKLLMKAGIQVGLITGRKSNALKHRCRDLGIDPNLLFEGIQDKTSVLNIIKEKTGVMPVESAYVGDDLPDLPLFREVGVAIAVSDAHECVKETSDMVTTAKGGAGAVREICDAVLKAKGLWDRIVKTSSE